MSDHLRVSGKPKRDYTVLIDQMIVPIAVEYLCINQQLE